MQHGGAGEGERASVVAAGLPWTLAGCVGRSSRAFDAVSVHVQLGLLSFESVFSWYLVLHPFRTSWHPGLYCAFIASCVGPA